MSNEPRLPGALRSHGPALLGYLLLTGWLFWPVVRDAGTRVLSDGGDGVAHLWSMWAIPRAILSGDSPFTTTGIFFPLGADTAFNTGMPLVSVLSWPLQAVFGLTVAANVVQLSAVVLSALGSYLLAHHVSGDRRAAFVAGAAFAFIPYRFGRMPAHFSLSHLEFLPFGLLALLLLYEQPTRRRALVFGAVVGLTFLTDLYYTVFLLLAALVVCAWHWRRTATREMGLRLAQSALAAGVVALPLAVAMFREAFVLHALDPPNGFAGADVYSSDLLSWVTPSAVQRIPGSVFAAVDREVTGGERLAFPGFAVLVLATAGAILGARRRRGVWVLVFGVFFVLSLGPFLHVNGWTGDRFETYGSRYSVPLPFFLLHSVPLLNGVRVPGRFSVAGILALDVLAALALARLGRGRPRLGWGACALALGITLAEFFPAAITTLPAAVPDPYAAIRADPDPGAVLEIPLQWRTGYDGYGGGIPRYTTMPMYYAIEHGKPLVNGMVARYPKRRIDELLGIPVYRQLVDLHQQGPATPATFTAADLRRLGIGFVVYHRDLSFPAVEAYLRTLGLPVLADDGTVVVWRVP